MSVYCYMNSSPDIGRDNLSGVSFARINTLLSYSLVIYSLTGTFPTKTYARRGNCDSRERWISASSMYVTSIFTSQFLSVCLNQISMCSSCERHVLAFYFLFFFTKYGSLMGDLFLFPPTMFHIPKSNQKNTPPEYLMTYCMLKIIVNLILEI